ncbi:esterase/lipase family protein [Desulfosarcina cetonica]|uniref:esterase/lipase family protein n=1 Tax=Desulfosarcina cetonica TaxID=90730 RepID=UPI00155DCCD5|nr:hypothetical protein [Desulfosarcina cetonica]
MISLLCGCFFRDLKNDLAEYDASYALVGKILNLNEEQQGKVIVILYSEEADGRRSPISCVFPEDSGHFSFLVKPGVYHLKAFEDSNENFDHDPGEYAGEFSDPIRITPVEANTAGKVKRARQNLDIQLSPKQTFIDDLDKLSDLAIEQMPVFKLGVIKKLNDGLFDEANGSIGYWKPLAFIKQFGVGIYFTEPFDPKRIPVLFVHGATGTPAGWQDIVDQLDKKRYQPWFYYYPSGIRLDVAAEILHGLIQTLHDQYRFDRLYITAHSMGGLVSRAAILPTPTHLAPSYVKLFVSMSTPWGGVRMAGKGAEKAPTAIPCWHDLAPGSEFIRTIYSRSLSPDIPFYLLFSYKGNCSLFMENNDETIELKSLLDYRAQDDAAGIYGFNEGHASILTSHETIVRYLEVLKSVQ